jgi:hypothetical protein
MTLLQRLENLKQIYVNNNILVQEQLINRNLGPLEYQMRLVYFIF